MNDQECAGKGRCHGCMCWCDHCGDVRAVCGADPEAELKQCDTHQCDRCFKILGRDDHDYDMNDGALRKFCIPCHLQIDLEDVDFEMMSAVKMAEYWASNGVPDYYVKFWSDQAERAASRLRILQAAACAT